MSKTKIYNLIDFALWIVNPILLISILFGERIETGLWLQWIGKMHPLALHFPIVFGISIAVYLLFFSKNRFHLEVEKILFASNALFASVVALLGVFLANQGSYEGEIFDLHKWGGFGIAIFSWMLSYMLNTKVILRKVVALAFLVVLIGATHKGAQLTHGVNALSFPQKESADQKKSEPLDASTSVFEAGIAPILNQKCISCHGPDKDKGNLRLDSRANILKGGRMGDILTASTGNEAYFTKLIHLPVEAEEHMPPDGSLQLTDLEKAILRNWVSSGSNFDLAIIDLPKEDSLSALIKEYLAVNKKVEIKTDLPDLDPYNTDYCTVNYLFHGSDKVEVNFFQASFYSRETLQRLLKIKDHIVRVNMQNMPLEKEDLELVTQFINLEKVNLNSTGLKISEIDGLKEMENLESIAICGMDFTEKELDELLSQANFTAINVWAENLDQNQLEELIAKYPDISFTIGDNLNNKVLKINSPVIEQDSLIIKTYLDVQLKHMLTGADIFYTIDGSQPDSLSQKYSAPIRVSQNTIIKAKAFKKGWTSSDVVQRTFYKSGITPDTIYLTKSPHPKYPGKGANTLIDRSLGETNISNGEWLGYQDHDLEFIIGFDETQALNSVEINTLTALAPHVFPLKSIAVSGSNNGKEFIPINDVDFPIAKQGTPLQAELSSCPLPKNTQYRFYRVIVSNVKKMPQWHAAKGKPAWVFVDEIFLN